MPPETPYPDPAPRPESRDPYASIHLPGHYLRAHAHMEIALKDLLLHHATGTITLEVHVHKGEVKSVLPGVSERYGSPKGSPD